MPNGDRAVRLLDLALARLEEAGLVRERTTSPCQGLTLYQALDLLQHLIAILRRSAR
ncbi:hypothetical protein [Streptomyces sp. NPDC059708]|uniref:hypothetical protein n=1 Tax=Streptomyces sp. NPDC059708 TaxID=3346916 RepID=UPI0036922EFC